MLGNRVIFSAPLIATSYVQIGTPSDTLTLSESVGLIKTQNISLTDSLTITDGVVKTKISNMLDTLSVSDSVSYIKINKTISVIDVITLSDGITTGNILKRSLSDALTPTDTVRRSQPISVNDLITLVEKLVVVKTPFIFTVDAINITETLKAYLGTQKVRDTIFINETLVARYPRTYSLSDSIVISEVLVPGAIPYMILSDSLDLGDTIISSVLPFTTLVEQILIGENIGLNIVSGISLADCLILSDLLQRVRPYSLSDTLVITDTLRKSWALIDVIIISESLGTNININTVCHTAKISNKGPTGDGIILGESLGLNIVKNISLSDSITLQDSGMLL
jgi:hypothetical protein